MIMNPHILTKARSVREIVERPGAYKLLANSMLPKFKTGKKQPACATLHPIAQTAQTSLFEQPPEAVKATVVETRESVIPPVGPVIPSQPVVSASPFSEGAKLPKKSYVRGTWKRTAIFCKRLVQRFIFGRKGRPVHKATVQTELALEKVTVLRNDLNEDDLEVVLVKRKVGTGEKPLARLSKMEMTGEAWTRLTAPFRKKNSESAISPKAETKPSPELSARA